MAAALRLKPDLIILDISMPLLNGIEAARQIKKVWPEAKLLFLTMHASPAYLKEAMDAGGMGYVLKSSANEELRSAVQKILKGQVYVTPSFDRDVLETVQPSLRGRPRPSAALTFRQAEVLQLVAEGWGNKEIADLLKVSVKTVDFHRGRIMRKLGAHNVAELVRYAVQCRHGGRIVASGPPATRPDRCRSIGSSGQSSARESRSTSSRDAGRRSGRRRNKDSRSHVHSCVPACWPLQ